MKCAAQSKGDNKKWLQVQGNLLRVKDLKCKSCKAVAQKNLEKKL